MHKSWIRSTLFNIAFFIITGILCIVYFPLLLLPRKIFVYAVEFWLTVTKFLEYSILNLRYEVRGREHLPTDGSFLVAAKHQSQYETFKLHLLFKDPAIILKRELLRIPLWGLYLKKSDVIAIDRSTPEKALKSIEDGALRMKAQGRPIVIFPQGTRVRPDENTAQKPYKAGIARVQAATELPIIPMALNTGLFWPRSGWLKASGTVIIEFLEPFQPGQHRKDLMRELEDKIEGASNALMNEARAAELQRSSRKSWIALGVVAAILFALYTGAWFKTAELVKEHYLEILKDVAGPQNPHIPVASGYPGPIRITVAEEFLQTPEGTLRIENLRGTGWPLPFLPVKIETGTITVSSFKWPSPLAIESANARITFMNDVVRILDSEVKQGKFIGGITGSIDLKQEPVPKFDLTVSLQNHSDLLTTLSALGIIETRAALFMSAGFGALADADGIVRVPLTQNGQTLYAGPLPVASLPVLSRQAPGNQPAPDL